MFIPSQSFALGRSFCMPPQSAIGPLDEKIAGCGRASGLTLSTRRNLKMAMETSTTTQLMDIAARIAEMRQISGFSVAEMAEKTEVSIDQYRS